MNNSLKFLFSCALVALISSCGGNSGKYREQITAEEWEQTSDVYTDQLTTDMTESREEQPDPEPVPQPEPAPEPAPANDSQSADSSLPPSTGASISPVAPTAAPEPPKRRIHTISPGNLAEVFNDSNHFQLQHAQRLGIEPITDLRSYYHTRRPLVKVTTNDDFFVEQLTHSYPYLVPEANRLLHDIGRRFRELVKERKGGDYRIKVTSMLRTPDTVKKLRRVNGNATENSTHQYATTFDISYSNFNAVNGKDWTNPYDLKMILAEVLHELHLEGRCMIKYERKSPCFHITVCK